MGSKEKNNVDRLLKERAEIDEELRRHKTPLTILFTDVVGSSAYFKRYGDTAGLAMLHRQADLAAGAVAEFRGRVIKTIGDSVMAEFPQPVLAVRAAIELQRRLRQLNETLPDRERVLLRIGIHSGVGFRSGSDVYGDAVNLAARITKHSGPAQILISRTIRDAVAAEPDIRFTSLGMITTEGRGEREELFELIWIDTSAYRELRERVTAALARGELVAHGRHLEDFVRPTVTAPLEESLGVMATELLTARYDIVGEVGRGGMGTVYKARDRETGDLLALKVLKPEIASQPAVLERFKNELRLARKITHKNVCRFHDFSRTDDVAFISMEFVEGESLRATLDRFGGVPLRKGIQIAQQICAALREAHAQEIIHRDLKPENIMLDAAGDVKVMDFGIARCLETNQPVTETIVGTPAYMAPEQAEGHGADHRSDLYALGLILYEMFTGAPAFSGDTPVAVALKQVREAPVPPRQLEPTLPPYVEEVILKCLEKDPAARFQSADELEAALTQQPLVSEPGMYKGPVTGEVASSGGRWTWWLGGSVVLAVIIIIVASVFPWRFKLSPGSSPALNSQPPAVDAQVQSQVPPPSPLPIQTTPQPPIQAPASPEPVKPKVERKVAPKEAQVPVRWKPSPGIYLEIGTYKEMAVARSVAHALRQLDFRVMIVPREELHHVWVGPYRKERVKLGREALASHGFDKIRQVDER